MSTVLIVSIVSIPFFAHASVQMTEIMYDPPAPESSHEWLEICNTGNETIDIAQWYVLDNTVKRVFTPVAGGTALSTHACAVVARTVEALPEYTGMLFTSTFSLANSGETLILKDEHDREKHSVTYDASLGGAEKDGESLQLKDGVWISALPTPGTFSGSSVDTSPAHVATPAGAVPMHTVVTYEHLSVEPPQDIYVRVEGDTTVARGSRARLIAELYNARGIVEPGGSVTWNFGDGTTFDGRIAEHVFTHVGTYIVSVHVRNGSLEARDTFSVSVFDPELSIRVSPDKKSIVLSNGTDHMVSIAGFRVSVGGSYFIFPEHTYVVPGDTVFLNTVLKLQQLGMSPEIILYDSGGVIIAHAPTSMPEKNVLSTEESPEVFLPAFTEQYLPAVDPSPPRVSVRGLVGTVVHASVPSVYAVPAETISEEFVAPSSAVSHGGLDDRATEEAYVASAAVGAFSPMRLEWVFALGILAVIGALGVFVSRSTYRVADTFNIEEDVRI